MSTPPLHGVKVLELAGTVPAPYCAMLLADLGADVVRVERPSGGLSLGGAARDVVMRGRRSLAVDVKTPEGRDLVLGLAERADVFLDVFRPGVAERLDRVLTDLGVEHDVKEYPDAGHSFLNRHNAGPFTALEKVLGIGYHGPSAEDAWARILRFLDRHLPAPS